MAGFTGSVELMLFAWILGGVLSLIGALCYAELATAFPNAGGDYHFLRRAYGKRREFPLRVGAGRGDHHRLDRVAGVRVRRLHDQVLPLGPYSSAIYAAHLTVVAAHGDQPASGCANRRAPRTWLTLLEVGGLLLVVVAGVMAGQFRPRDVTAAAPAAAATFVPAMFGLAMVFVLLTYGGWNEAAYISAEVKGGKRAILKALVLAILLITVAYLVVISRCCTALGFEGMQGQQGRGRGRDDARRSARSAPADLGASVAVATLTSINATMLVGARTNYALGRDWPLLRVLGRWDGERGTPVARLARAGSRRAWRWSRLGAVGSGFKAMVEFTAPVFWLFFLLTGVAAVRAAGREPHVARPFKVPLYPILPLAFIATCGYLLYSSITYAQSQRAVHIAFYVMLVGLVAWIVARLKRGT